MLEAANDQAVSPAADSCEPRLRVQAGPETGAIGSETQSQFLGCDRYEREGADGVPT